MSDPTINTGFFIGMPTYYYDVPLGATDYSNDTGLNSILYGNNIIAYDFIEFLPQVGPSGDTNWTLVVCDNCNHTQLASDLNGYSTVVNNAYPLDDRFAYNALHTKIVDLTIGIPTGMSGGIITTNDSGLNAIFSSHNVYYYTQYCPLCTNIENLKVYELMCSCNANLLKADLNAYNAVIDYTDRVYLSSQSLNLEDVEKPQISLSSNPVNDKLIFNNYTVIKYLEIYSLTGNRLILQDNITEPINVSNLSKGIYFAKVYDTLGNQDVIKFFKN